MQRFIDEIYRSLAILFHQEFFVELSQNMQPHIKELQKFNFSFTNPIFGILVLTVLFLLSSRWGLKKAFSYCLLISSLLVINSKLRLFIKIPINSSGLTVADIASIIILFVIGIISIYYFMIKKD